ncbi:phosphotransferase family protein [Novosphingobium cyanobacteriorum]|uniref:Phosphotransferase family protein n=1 Tax=Novosphingobium cyanobacteriorum TaxID=3024215 RepID=A0ABT6CMI3_9SPHN|nr:phosphotransferase family protein [Novosphingobium cyanobacteriorum]MDF8335126.1 phosphotransferase family protein [Novosphingobium cyanobacteriorum]
MPETAKVDIAEANKGAGKVRVAFDEAALAGWMAANVEGFAGPLTVDQFNGGQSNPTYRLSTPGQRYVLRRKPPGQLVKGAHDVLREARVQQGLAGSAVPVARIFAVCEDEGVIGSPFYVMDMVEGRIIWDAAFTEVPKAERAAYFDEMNRVIAALHSVDHVAAGLGDYGKPGNYFARQIGRWSRQYLEDELAGRLPDMDALVEWLPTAIPEGDETTIVHGDFRCDNMIFHPTEPRVLAVLDWELSTLGHPLADFAYHAMMYRMPADIVAGLGGADPVPLGLPTEAEYIAAYCARTGRDGIPNWDFYLAFNFFRLAAIFHGIKGRVERGTATNAQARERAQALPRIVALAREAMEKCR